MKKTKRQPQDTTFRNINALKKRVTLLEEQMKLVYKLLEFKKDKKRV